MDNLDYFKNYYNNNNDIYKNYYLKYKNSHLTECETSNKSYLNIQRHNESKMHNDNIQRDNIINE